MRTTYLITAVVTAAVAGACEPRERGSEPSSASETTSAPMSDVAAETVHPQEQRQTSTKARTESMRMPVIRDTIDEADDWRGGEGGREPWDAPPIVGTTTITSQEVETTPATEEPQGYQNRSTVLGDGTSGMYTGGEGTYGGRATWGTGSGVTK